MSGSKAPDFDTYELLRATHYHNSTQYSHIVELSSLLCSYVSYYTQDISPFSIEELYFLLF